MFFFSFYHILLDLQESQLVFGRLIVRAWTYLKNNLDTVQLMMVVAIIVQLACLDEVIIAPAYSNFKFILKLPHKGLSLLIMTRENELVLQFCASDRPIK